jgi:hypothetical protein
MPTPARVGSDRRLNRVGWHPAFEEDAMHHHRLRLRIIVVLIVKIKIARIR